MFVVMFVAKKEYDSASPADSDNYSNNSNSPRGMPLFYGDSIDNEKCRYPHSIVWTPIPLLT